MIRLLVAIVGVLVLPVIIYGMTAKAAVRYA